MSVADTNAILRQIGAKIAYYRKIRDITQEQLAAKVSVSRSTVSRIERGDYNLSVRLLFRIASALGVSPAEIFQLSETAGSWEVGMYYSRK